MSPRLLADIIYTHHEIGIRNERLFRVGKPDGILDSWWGMAVVPPEHVMFQPGHHSVMLVKQIWVLTQMTAP